MINEYFCIFYCVSSGQNENNLGSDEQELINLCYLIFDLNKLQVFLFCYLVT